MDSFTPIWPEALALPGLVLSGRQDPQRVRTEMETGRFRNRRQFLDPLETLNARWSFVQDDFDTFKTFFETELVNGSLSFAMEVYGVVTEVAFLESKYSFTRSDNLFVVSAVLQYVPQ